MKGFLSASIVQVSTYLKPELIQLVKAVANMNLPNDLNFENDSSDESLLRCFSLSTGQKISDLFQN